MSCYHLCECDRCRGVAERLTTALLEAIEEIEKYNLENEKLHNLRLVVGFDGHFNE